MPQLIKPFRLGLLHRTLVEPTRKLLVVSTFGLFDFGHDADLELEQGLWPLAAEMLGEGAALDGGMPKACGEVLVGGKGIAPRGKPVERLNLSLRIGAVDKCLVAVGPRYWKPNGGTRFTATEPLPFVDCPLDYGAAFGGGGFERNPIGRGYGSEVLLGQGRVAPLPLLERRGEPVTKVSQAYEPVAFGQLGYTWPQRSRYLGTLDETYFAERWPACASDMRRELFNEAPSDQWIDGFFRGDEPFELGGMHADEPLLRGRLPGVTSRCFIKFADRAEAPLCEIPMFLDTVWLFGCAKKGVVTFRGIVEVNDSDALDVSHIMVGWEKLDDRPRDAAYYEEVFRLRTDPETAADNILADSQLGPIVAPEELARRAEERLALSRADNDAFDQMVDAQLAKAKQQPGVDDAWKNAEAMLAEHAPDQKDALSSFRKEPSVVVPTITPGDLERMDFDIAGIRSAVAQLEEEAEAELAKAEAQREEAQRQADDKLAEHGIDPDKDKEAEQRARVERQAGVAPQSALGFEMDRMLGLLDTLDGDQTADAQQKAREAVEDAGPRMDEALADARRLSPEPIDVADPLLASVAAYFGTLIVAGLADGRSYRGRDLAGADLRGCDLSNCDLHGCFLERANLEGADLSGADLTTAVLTGANIKGANLEGAKLAGANLSHSDATAADFSDTELREAQLMKAKLTDARLSRAIMVEVQGVEVELAGASLDAAVLTKATLIEANLERVNADGADLSGAILINTQLGSASFRGAKLVDAVLVGVAADDVCFDDAMIEKALFGHGSSLARASFRQVLGPRASFRGANLDNASFERAVLDEADMGGAQLRRADMNRASLRSAILTGADLRDAQLQHANLREAVMRKTVLDRADLSQASLYCANTDEASFADARLTAANTFRARITR